MLAVHHKTPDDPERLLDHTIARILQKRDAAVAVGQPALGRRGPPLGGPPALGHRWGRRHWAALCFGIQPPVRLAGPRLGCTVIAPQTAKV